MPMPTDPAKAAKSKANLLKGGAGDAIKKHAKVLRDIAEKMKPGERATLQVTKAQLISYSVWYEERKGGIGVATAYRPEFCNDVIKFFKDAADKPFEIMEVVAKDKSGNVILDKKTGQPIYYNERIPNMPPYLVDFAIKIGVLVGVLNDWAKAHPDFNLALAHAKEIRTKMLVNNGLTGLYDPQSWIFTAKNIAGMSDKTEAKVESEVSFKVKLQRFDNPENSDEVVAQQEKSGPTKSNMLR